MKTVKISVPASFGANPSHGTWTVVNHPRVLVDLTGDKRADIVGFANQGVYVSLNLGNGKFGPHTMAVANQFGSDAGSGGFVGLDHPKHAIDLDRNGRADLIGFGPDGVWVAMNNGAGGFGLPALAVAAFGSKPTAGGWHFGHDRFLADVTGDGKPDIVGFGDNGVWVSTNNGSGLFSKPVLVSGNFGNSKVGGPFGEWTRAKNRQRFMADINGDGRADIVAFGDNGVWVSRNLGGLAFGAPEKAHEYFGSILANGGWNMAKHVRHVVDMTGDGRADILGFGDKDVWIARNLGDGTFDEARKVAAGFTIGQGWDVARNPRFLEDITGNGRRDIVGIADDGVWLSKNNGDDTFGAPVKLSPDFGTNAGWDTAKHIRLMADVTGDGRRDVVGFFDDGVYLGLS